MDLLDWIANIATILTIISFLAGMTMCRTIYKAGSTTDTSSLPFIFGTFCTYLWLRYGLLLNDSTMIFVNVIGFSLQSFYVIWFYIFTIRKTQIIRRILLLILILLLIHLYINYSVDPRLLIGSMACMGSLFVCASPLPMVLDVVLKTKCTEKLPLALILSSFFVTMMWFTYGYLIGDIFVQLPNGLGAIISGIQLSLFMIYPSKRNVKISRKKTSKNKLSSKDIESESRVLI